MKVTTLIVLLVAFCVSTTQAFPSLRDVCSGSGSSLASTEEAKKLISALGSSGADCGSEFRQSIYDLEPVLSATNLGDVCGKDSIDAISNYHAKYISGQQDLRASIPRGVRNFFIVFATDVTTLCNRQLISRFAREFKREIFQLRDVNQMNEIENELMAHLGIRVQQKQVRHLNDLVMRPASGDNSPKIHLLISSSNKSDKFYRTYEACLNRYNAVGRELFEPVLRLRSYGYGNGQLTMQESMSLQSREYVPWVTAIKVCQILSNEFDIILTSEKLNSPQFIGNNEIELSRRRAEQPAMREGFDSIPTLQVVHEPVKFVQLTHANNVRVVLEKFEHELKKFSSQ